MSLLVPSGSPSFTPLLHHHVSLGPEWISFLHIIAPPPSLYWSPADLLHHIAPPPCLGPEWISFLHIAPPPCLSWSSAGLQPSPCLSRSQRVSFLHHIAPPPCLSWSPAGLLPSPHCSTTMSLLVPSGSPSFTTLLHHHVSLGPQRVSFLHHITPPQCLSWVPAGLPSPHCPTTVSLLVPSGSPSFTSLLHHHVSLGPQRVSVIHLIPRSPCPSWSPAGLLPSPHYSTIMSLLVPGESPSIISFIHHHVSLGPQRVSFLHLIDSPPRLYWSPAGLLPSPYCSTTMSLLVPNGSPSFTSLLHHHVSLGPQRVSFLHIITPPPSLSCSPASLLHSHHCSTTTSLLVPSGSTPFTSLPHHRVSPGPQRVSFLHLITPPPCLSWSPAGLLPSPHCSTTMSLLVPSGSPSFTTLLHHHVSLGPQRVSFLHLIAPPPCLSWSPAWISFLHPIAPPPCLSLSPAGLPFTSLLHHNVSLGHRRVSFIHLIAPPPCLSWSPAGLLPSHHYSTTMSLLGPSGSPSFTTLLHHHVSLGPR